MSTESLPSPAATSDHALRRQLTLRDLVLSQILNVVGTAWVGIAAGLGSAQALVWISAMLLFYGPMAVSVYFLNRPLPLEGGLHAWARQAFGNAGGFMTAWNIWAYGMTVTAAILYQVPSELAYLIGPRAAGLPENHLLCFALLATILAVLTLAAVRGLELGKWIHNVSGAAMLVVFAVLILLPLWAIARGEPLNWAPMTIHMPRMNMESLALMGQMFGALSGLEYIAILAGESRDPGRSIGRSVMIASPLICTMFILGTGSVVAFAARHPGTHIDYIAPIPQTLRWALGSSGVAGAVGTAVIVLLPIRILGAASLLFTGVTRLPMAAGWDHLIPEWFTRLHPRRKTPVNSIAVSAGIIALLLVVASLGVHAQEAFQVLNNASSALYSLAYLAMFAIPLLGARMLREQLPSWVRWTSAVGLLATLFSFLLTAYPFVDVVAPGAYAAKILGTTAVANALGYTFYRLRNRSVSSSVSHIELSIK